MANGIVRRGSLTSEAMMAMRRKPLQLQRRMALPPDAQKTRSPSTGTQVLRMAQPGSEAHEDAEQPKLDNRR